MIQYHHGVFIIRGDDMKINIKQQLLLMMASYSYQDCWNYLQCYRSHPDGLKEIEKSTFEKILFALHKEGFLKTYNPLEVIPHRVLIDWSLKSIMIGETMYPEAWYHIPQPPIIIFYQGDLNLLLQPKVAIIGTRSISQYGREMSQQISQAIVQQGWVTVSGLAKGVDTIVHETSLKSRSQSTIAIIPNGMHVAYPKVNHQLQKNISQQGLLLSEFLPQTPVRKFQFIMRNRLVAGLCPVTIIIEAAHKSGSLITANYALQFNKEVIALPGPIHSSTSKGCNELIYHGARPIYTIDQLIEDISCIFSNQFI